MVVFLETCPVLTDIEGFRLIGEGFGSFENDKVVDLISHLSYANFQPF